MYFKQFLDAEGISVSCSCPHTPQQNGVVDRKHQHITSVGNTLSFQACLPKSFWFDSFVTATYLINRIPTKLLQFSSPYEILFNKLPDYSLLKVFGCACYPYLGPYKKDKLSPKSSRCTFLGYSSLHKGYRCYENSTKKIYISRHVVFDETIFPFCCCTSSTTVGGADTSTTTDTSTTVGGADISTRADTSAATTLVQLEIIRDSTSEPLTDSAADSISAPPSPFASSDIIDESFNAAPSLPTVPPTHTMVTRSKDGIVKPKYFPDFVTNYTVPHPIHSSFTSIVTLPKDPRTFKSAIKSEEWIQAMQQEYEALMLKHTCPLVEPTPEMNVLGRKWVYKLKLKPDGTIDRHKSILVAQGCSQQDGIDYTATFSPIVNTTTIRVIITIALTNK